MSSSRPNYNLGELDHLQGQIHTLTLAVIHLLKGGGSATSLFDTSYELEDRIESVDKEALEGPEELEAYHRGMFDALIFIDRQITNYREDSPGSDARNS